MNGGVIEGIRKSYEDNKANPARIFYTYGFGMGVLLTLIINLFIELSGFLPIEDASSEVFPGGPITQSRIDTMGDPFFKMLPFIFTGLNFMSKYYAVSQAEGLNAHVHAGTLLINAI